MFRIKGVFINYDLGKGQQIGGGNLFWGIFIGGSLFDICVRNSHDHMAWLMLNTVRRPLFIYKGAHNILAGGPLTQDHNSNGIPPNPVPILFCYIYAVIQHLIDSGHYLYLMKSLVGSFCPQHTKKP